MIRSLCDEFCFLNFFNAENRGKKRSHPLGTTTPERKRQNTDIPESKAPFVVYNKTWTGSSDRIMGPDHRIGLSDRIIEFDHEKKKTKK